MNQICLALYVGFALLALLCAIGERNNRDRWR